MNEIKTIAVHKDDSLWQQLFRNENIRTVNIAKHDSKIANDWIDTLYLNGTLFREPDFRQVLSSRDYVRIAFIGSRAIIDKTETQIRQAIATLNRASHQSDKRKPVILTGGLAYGNDMTAQDAALALGIPTVAVLPTSIDQVFPFGNRALAERIYKRPGACLLSQFPDGTQPNALTMIRRRMLLTYLADIIIVTSTMATGGTTVNARVARQYGIPVYAFPGDLDDTQHYGGNHLLIQQGLAQIIPDYSFFETIL